MNARFEIDALYEIESFRYVEVLRVVSRSAKWVIFEDETGETHRARVNNDYGGNEIANLGAWVSAERTVTEETAGRHWSRRLVRGEIAPARTAWADRFYA